MDLSADPQHLYLQRSALEASFPPAKANLLPQATAEEQPCSEEKTLKSHITDNKVFSEMLDILTMKCRRTYDNKTS